ncbi:enoyl-CoA hydratase-related protein [Actinomadura parmotrematis]|uniref:Enoyl-CoA hydratase/isomerase family protein n=1 Tax=Actinomadura parmotrematis TaxID=2864039 RepID=A0ABS7FSW9_9ACTN|nr:enoyl-CoA hydratase-related protein [Actinomadura parmotrematis]MBW8482633.1 enoyl-CoA hydratase/isomerase family protein [Actinomadura parmotrematis]
MSGPVRAERDGAVLVLTLDRPAARNALDPALMGGLSEALRAADADPGVRAIVLTGAGTVFCAGLDLKAFAAGGDIRGLVWFYHRGTATPVVAALNGHALGGGFELALACDLAVAAEGAELAMTEVRRGLFASGGGTTLPARIPMALALEMGLTGDRVTAARALDMGLVNRVVPPGEVLGEACALAARIAANGPLGVAMTKRLMRERRWGSRAEVDEVFTSADAREGARAFAERRPPVWTGT